LIAVDNRYPGLIDGWEHYQAWEFVGEVAEFAAMVDANRPGPD